MKYTVLFLLLFVSVAHADEPVRLQQVKVNLYTDLNTERMIRTRNCREAVFWDGARLFYNPGLKGYEGSKSFRNYVIFSNKKKCLVEDVYYPPGKKKP